MTTRLENEMTGLDVLIGCGYRRGDKRAFITKSTVTNGTRNHEDKFSRRQQSRAAVKRAIERIHADGASHIAALVY